MPDPTYCTKADITGLASEFTIPAAYSDADVLEIIAEQMQVIDSLCRTHFASITRSFILSGSGEPTLSFRSKTQLKAQSITSVQYREAFAQTDDFAVNGTLEDATSYGLLPSRTGLERLSYSSTRTSMEMRYDDYVIPPVWVKGNSNYKVTGVFGYAYTPRPIRTACVMLCREAMQAGYILANLEPKVSEKFADGYSYQTIQSVRQAVTKAEQLTGFQSIDNMLLPYRNNVPILIST